MIITDLKAALTTAGCTAVLYESKELAGIITDRSLQTDIVGLILEPTSVRLETKGNGVQEHYPPVTIEIMKQAPLEETAENNQAALESLLVVCKAFILALIATGKYKKINSVDATRILESRYDANLIGWSLPMDLYYLENKTNC